MALKLIRKFAVASLLTLLSSATVSAQTLVFTAIPDEDETKLVERFTGIADYLAGELDVDVRYIPVKSYAAAVSAFRNNQVQLAWFGGLSGVQARELVPGSEAIAQGVEDKAFYTHFIAHKSTGLDEMETLSDELQGKTFTFGSKGSTSGRLIPEYYIRESFEDSPDNVFSRVGFSGNHTRTLRLVEAGTYDVGAINFSVWDKEMENGNIDTDAVKVIWTTPSYPNYQWSVRGDVNEQFGEGFQKRLQEALLAMDDPELLESFPRSGFIPVSNDAYEPIRVVGKQIGIID
ncbi:MULTISPECIES: putative selenate ABC transporter substrate-binding protein [Marinobacter]|jgi:phosphonate transport system substrate-binding protein|uniref:Phosphonate ABC transporter substrate-binding protein n=1 Tax=Marinobacter salarius TaxID=1420917 RepID=W5YQZ3_9GAMM|nr:MULTISPECIES: putative selenate ABC transporter substrate-binding protein [Marinobacter]AHI31309.1 phosphonate ABC transporter substrate-binding protein [Marinobacter salarius]KXJ46031.1 MAG: phosphonate ABC transporter substrate-binding protein [Marinobacter sp. Hex_13]MBS8232510.1 putative selenate ABC transporter substrate-binding protein [Marinobacter salarius]MDC8455491.1 putative selenate ABC transporter substrate-binding protein [Marinobacter sp. DS40M6]SFM05959.1 phosphonate transpo|tara:strand:- start:1495 stop:2364 length:870 start_codon:yes stop_codon:yes gene_type:complete